VPINRLLILDVETAGVTPQSACIEVAVSVFDVPHASVVRSFSSLIRGDRNQAFHVNQIHERLLQDAPLPDAVWSAVARSVERCEAIVSHNANFDRRYVPTEVVAGRPWFCSCYDFAWPAALKAGSSLSALARDHSVPLGGVHRAAADVDTLARLFAHVDRVSNLTQLIDRALAKAAGRSKRPAP
jgi:DNA polymerase III alpha subunit (gram-positive type)